MRLDTPSTFNENRYYSVTYTPEQIKILCSLANSRIHSKNTTFIYSLKIYPKLELLKFDDKILTINDVVITKITTRVHHKQIVVNFYRGKKLHPRII